MNTLEKNNNKHILYSIIFIVIIQTFVLKELIFFNSKIKLFSIDQFLLAGIYFTLCFLLTINFYKVFKTIRFLRRTNKKKKNKMGKLSNQRIRKYRFKIGKLSLLRLPFIISYSLFFTFSIIIQTTLTIYNKNAYFNYIFDSFFEIKTPFFFFFTYIIFAIISYLSFKKSNYKFIGIIIIYTSLILTFKSGNGFLNGSKVILPLNPTVIKELNQEEIFESIDKTFERFEILRLERLEEIKKELE